MTAGRLVCPALRWRPESGFSHEAAAIDAALALGVGGFIIFGVGGARADEIAELTQRIRSLAGRPLLLASDMERGAGQQARGLTPIPPPAARASLHDDAGNETKGKRENERNLRRLPIDVARVSVHFGFQASSCPNLPVWPIRRVHALT